MKNGGWILWNAVICEVSNTPWQMVKTPCERRFGATVQYHPISAKDQSRLRHFGKTVSPGIFLGMY